MAPLDPKSLKQWLNERRLVAFGAGNAFLALQETSPFPFEYVVDDTAGYAGQKIAGVPILNSDALLREKSGEIHIVICANTSTAISAIGKRLTSSGFRAMSDFVDCSWLQRDTITRRLQDKLGVTPDTEDFAVLHSLVSELRCKNLSGIAGPWLFVRLIAHFGERPGSVAECGVYRGANALRRTAFSLQIFARTPLHLFSTALKASTPFPPQIQLSRRGQFADVIGGRCGSHFCGFSKCDHSSSATLPPETLHDSREP